MKMPEYEEALAIIEAKGHTLPRDEFDRVTLVEWGDTPCSGPQCTKCGDSWCLWENYLEVDDCEGGL